MSWYVFMERMTDMFQNNRKTIGVFAEGVRYEFQRKLCQGIIEEAEKEGFNVAIFFIPFTKISKYIMNEKFYFIQLFLILHILPLIVLFLPSQN